MNKKILLIGENISSFILNSIREALEKEEYEVSYAAPTVKALGNLQEKPDIVVIYGGEFVDNNMDAMVYLKDYCVEQEKKICLIGYTQQIATLQKYIGPELIWNSFERPLNVKQLVAAINTEVEITKLEEQKKHILIVDDSGTMLRTIKAWLTPKYKVSMASSAAMAISFLATNKPDLILLDYEMPVCSGPQFLEMIRAEISTSRIPVIFLTAKGDKESVKSVLALKPAGYLLKTMNAEQIVENIDNFFEKNKVKC